MKTEFGPNNFLLETTTVTTYVHKESITQLTSPKKIIGLKNCMFSGTNNTVIKCLNFSENSDRVYIISISGRKRYNNFCVSRMIVFETVRV